jgi:hypothetical protein
MAGGPTKRTGSRRLSSILTGLLTIYRCCGFLSVECLCNIDYGGSGCSDWFGIVFDEKGRCDEICLFVVLNGRGFALIFIGIVGGVLDEVIV